MKIEINIKDECADRVVLAALRGTLECVSDPKFAELYPDRDTLASACKTLIEYYAIPRQ